MQRALRRARPSAGAAAGEDVGDRRQALALQQAQARGGYRRASVAVTAIAGAPLASLKASAWLRLRHTSEPRETMISSSGRSGLQLLGTSGRKARVAAPRSRGRRPPELRLSLRPARPYPSAARGSAQKLRSRWAGCPRCPSISTFLEDSCGALRARIGSFV